MYIFNLTSESLLKNIAILNSAEIDIFIVVDEAHCVLDWGKEFRKDFLSIHKLRIPFNTAPMLAMTATASHRHRQEIAQKLCMAIEFSCVHSDMPINDTTFLEIRKRLPASGKTIARSEDSHETIPQTVIRRTKCLKRL